MPAAQQQERAQWLGLLARADCAWLQEAWQSLDQGLPLRLLAAPETGMLRLSTGATQDGPQFQFGEASCTRCVVKIGQARGYAVQLGSDLLKARLSACMDAVLQDMAPARRSAILAPILQRIAEQEAKQAQTLSATRVRFYTTKTSNGT